MKRLTVAQWVTILTELTNDLTHAEVKKKLQQFLLLVQTRRATKLLPRIITRYAAEHDSAHGIVHVNTVAARELPAHIIMELKKLGTDVVMHHTVDPQVVGGLRLQVGDLIIDGTISRTLRKLYEN